MTATYDWTLLRAGTFRLDGGGMFGVIPRVVWTRAVQPDDRNRVELQHNCLLLEGGPPGGRKRVLIECGTGGKLDDKMREIFALEDRTVEDAVREAGTDPAQIDAAIVSHLHFDHAGGLTRRPRNGENGGEHNAVPTFPSAEVFVQRREWEDALAARSVMTKTYYRDHLDPIRDRVRCVESPPPFEPGQTPDPTDSPAAPLNERATQILPGIDVFLVPGHTWGQQAVRFTDTKGRTVVFTPDLMPTVHHVGTAYSLAYDVEPYTSMVTKRWFLEEAAEQDWLLVLDHEPGNPLQRVRRTEKGWFELRSEQN